MTNPESITTRLEKLADKYFIEVACDGVGPQLTVQEIYLAGGKALLSLLAEPDRGHGHPCIFVQFTPGYEHIWHHPIHKQKANFVRSASTIRFLEGVEYAPLTELLQAGAAHSLEMQHAAEMLLTQANTIAFSEARVRSLTEALNRMESWFRKWERDCECLKRTTRGGWPDGDGSSARENWMDHVLPDDIAKARQALSSEVPG